MTDVVVLRFRDLVTEAGGTIHEHLRIRDEQGAVWWGWWMRQSERPPLNLFKSLLEQIDAGVEPAAWLFDTGQELLHRCRMADLRVAPADETIGPPSLDMTPSYYQRGTYPAWFLLADITATPETNVPEGWRFAAFPSNPDRSEHQELVGESVDSLEQLRNTDATIWLIASPE
jgi:hypothetical protein